MSWPDVPRLTRLAAALALAGLTAGCFQPIYGEHTGLGNAAVGSKLSSVEVVPVDAANGTRIARVGVNLRNDLIFELTGGGSPPSATHLLKVNLTGNIQQVIVDINTARPDIENYALNATYTLTDIATGKVVITGSTFSRVTYDIPGQQQRFVGTRGLRDAENRAAKSIAEDIRTRLASYFVAGT